MTWRNRVRYIIQRLNIFHATYTCCFPGHCCYIGMLLCHHICLKKVADSMYFSHSESSFFRLLIARIWVMSMYTCCWTYSMYTICNCQISNCIPTTRLPGPASIYDKTSYRKLSWRLEAARLVVWTIASLWNMTSTSAALLPSCLSDFRVIVQF